MKTLLSVAVASIVAGVTPNYLAAQGSQTVLVVAANSPGTTSFIVDAPGKIEVKLSAPSTVTAELRGPNGVAASAKGSGPLALSYDVTAADVAKSHVWGLVVTGSAAMNIDATIVHPGTQYTRQQMASLPEAKAQQAERQAAFDRLKNQAAASTPKTPTVDQLNAIARTVGAKVGTVDASTLGQLRKATTPARAHPVLATTPNLARFPAGTYVTAPAGGTTAGTTTPSGSGSSSGASAPPAVLSNMSGIQVTNADINGNQHVAQCANSLCLLHSGDVLQIMGTGFNKIAHEVHLGFITANSDILANVVTWNDNVITAQVPPTLHGVANQSGFIWLGASGASNQSNDYVFDYKQTSTTMALSFNPGCYPALSSIMGGGSGFIPGLGSSGYWLNFTVWEASQSGLPGVGGKGDDILLMGVMLQNNWTVDHVEFTSGATGLSGSAASITEQHPHTGNAQVTVHWWYNGFSAITYSVQIVATGEANTFPYVAGYGPPPC